MVGPLYTHTQNEEKVLQLKDLKIIHQYSFQKYSFYGILSKGLMIQFHKLIDVEVGKEVWKLQECVKVLFMLYVIVCLTLRNLRKHIYCSWFFLIFPHLHETDCAEKYDFIRDNQWTYGWWRTKTCASPFLAQHLNHFWYIYHKVFGVEPN